MTLPLSWTHDGQPHATIALQFIRATPVGVGVSMRIDGTEQSTAHVPGLFKDEGLGWSVSFQVIPTTGIGVHVRERAITPDVREIVVSMSNCVTDRATHPGAVYFSELEIRFAAGWSHWTLERPTSSGVQFFPNLAMLTRRFVVYRGPHRQTAHDRLYAWEGEPIRHFGPSGIDLVPYSHDSSVLVQRVRQGRAGDGFYPESEYLGVWFPFGDPKAYAHGGEDIFPSPRVLPALAHAIRADGTAERERAICLNLDGSITEAHQWPSDFEYQCDRGSNHTMRLPPFKGVTIVYGTEDWREKKLNQGSCPYEAGIQTRQNEVGFSAHDPHHGCRRLLDDLGLYYRTGDMLARMRIQMAAQDYMTSYRITQVGNEDPNAGWVMHSLHQLITEANRNPHAGGRIQREMGWISWTVAHALCITPPSPMRESMKAWLREWFRYMAIVRLSNGTYYCGWPDWSDDGIPWNASDLAADGWTLPPLARNEGELPVFQWGILCAGMDEAAYAIGIKPAIADACTFIYGKPELWIKDKYEPNGRGPAWYCRVYGPSGVDAEYTTGVQYAHTVHSRDSLCRAYRRTRDGRFLELARRVATMLPIVIGESPKETLHRTYKDSTDPWGSSVRAITKPVPA
jgi:hypothetical protein